MRALVLLLAATFALHATNYYITVAGLGGSPEYETQFVKWAGELQKELQKNGPDVQVTTLAGSVATRDALKQTLVKLAGEMKPEDQFALFLIGHGTFDGADYKFNLPGPDVSAGELAAMLDRLPSTHQLVVNMTSCSGASSAPLTRKDRIVITATKSGTEKNATVFPRFWIDALRDPAADTDKDGALSTLELYRYTAQKTAAYFETQKLLATEHPTLTDTGAAGTRDPGAQNGQGLLAARFLILQSGEGTAKNVAPGKRKLVSKKEELEARIDKLKYQKAAMTPEEYKQQLTALLLDLARTQAEIDH